MMVKARRVTVPAVGVALTMAAAPAGVALMMKGAAQVTTMEAWAVETKQKSKATGRRCEESAVGHLPTLKNGIGGVPGLRRRDKVTSRSKRHLYLACARAGNDGRRNRSKSTQPAS
jgi:hypothetical protein